MAFVIQVCNPRVQRCNDVFAADVADALQIVFPMITEEAFLIWNGVPLGISYKYDLSVLIDDLLPLLEALLNSERGSYEVNWGSDTFTASWTLDWADEQIKIGSRWSSAKGLEDSLNARSQVEISLIGFLREWKSILKKIVDSVEASGVVVKNQASLDLLSKIEQQIPLPGYLYSEQQENG